MHSNYVIFLSFLMGVFLLSCRSNKELSRENGLNKSSEAYQLQSLEGAPHEAELFFRLRKTPCFGKCPVYTFNMYQNGLLIYEGGQNVSLEGVYKGIAPIWLQDSILRQVEALDFFNLNDIYPSGERRIVDLPSTILFLQHDGQQKEVVNKNYYDPAYPEEESVIKDLDDFSDTIELWIRDIEWEAIGLKDGSVD